MMVVHCSKIKIQRDEEARGTARRTWEGHRKGEVECVEDNLLGFSDSGGAACEGMFLVLSYTLLLLLACPGNGCYFLRNRPFTMFFFIMCERTEPSTIMSREI